MASKIIRIQHINHLRTGFQANDIQEERFIEAEFFYNLQGYLTKEIHYNSLNHIESTVENEYNDDGLPILSAQYDESGELCQKNTFAYNDKGDVTRKGCFYGEFSPEYATIYVYEKGILQREDSYDEDVFSHTEKTYEYDPKGRLHLLTEFDEDGNILYKTTDTYNEEDLLIKRLHEEVQENDSRTFIFEYDENKHKTKELLYNYNDKLIAKAYYRYDAEGNVIEMEEENLDIFRLTRYTYEGKNCIKIAQFDKNDTLLSWSDYVYDDQNEISEIKNYILDEVNPTEHRLASEQKYITEWH